MALIINPPVGAIPVYPWMVAQEFYVSILEIVSAAQEAIDPEYYFDVTKNKLEPYEGGESVKMRVNVNIGERQDAQSSMTNKTVKQSFVFELLALSADEGNDHADFVAIERAQYLAAMVEYGLTALYNNQPTGINIGDFAQREVDVRFLSMPESRKANTMNIYGTLTMACEFSINYEDWTLPDLTLIQTAIDGIDYQFPV